jgi:hypothetical protein
MSEQDNSGQERIESRTRRALEEPLTVLTPDFAPVEDQDATVVSVTSHSGSSYTVDVREERCTCKDFKHRTPEGGCKHIRRARFALGREPVDSQVITEVDVDPELAVNAPGPVVATSDGGLISDNTEVFEHSPVWEGPHAEYDRYGQLTGSEFVKCSRCGVEVLEGQEDNATHSEDCPGC